MEAPEDEHNIEHTRPRKPPNAYGHCLKIVFIPKEIPESGVGEVELRSLFFTARRVLLARSGIPPDPPSDSNFTTPRLWVRGKSLKHKSRFPCAPKIAPFPKEPHFRKRWVAGPRASAHRPFPSGKPPQGKVMIRQSFLAYAGPIIFIFSPKRCEKIPRSANQSVGCATAQPVPHSRKPLRNCALRLRVRRNIQGHEHTFTAHPRSVVDQKRLFDTPSLKANKRTLFALDLWA